IVVKSDGRQVVSVKSSASRTLSVFAVSSKRWIFSWSFGVNVLASAEELLFFFSIVVSHSLENGSRGSP
ncbi:MAG: hypothetical protein ABGZ53_15560, partial [Fuerstiella sp.]